MMPVLRLGVEEVEEHYPDERYDYPQRHRLIMLVFEFISCSLMHGSLGRRPFPVEGEHRFRELPVIV
jgi:hypothetical protein